MLGREFTWFERVSLLHAERSPMHHWKWHDLIERLTCMTQNGDYVAMTNRMVLLQVGPLLRDKCAEHNAEYFDVGSLKSCRCLRTNWPHFARTAGSERNWYIRIPGVNVVFWQLCWFGAPATQYRPRGFLFSFLSAIVRTILAPKWRQRLLSRGILTARIKYHFWGQKGSTLKVCKIVTFDARRLKLYVWPRFNSSNQFAKWTSKRKSKTWNIYQLQLLKKRVKIL